MACLLAIPACGQANEKTQARGDLDGSSGSGGTRNDAGGAGGGATSGAGMAGVTGTAQPQPAGGSAGSSTAVDPNCEVELLDSDCRVGAVARLRCNAPLGVSTAEQRGRTWIYVRDAPEGFPPLHEVDCEEHRTHELAERPPGVLLPSYDEAPYVVERVDGWLNLYRGLPDQIRSERVETPMPMNVFVGPDSVLWWRGGIGGLESEGEVELYEAPTLEDTPQVGRAVGVTAIAPRLYLHDGRPSAVARVGEEWFAVSSGGNTPIETLHGGLDWSFDGERPISLVERWTNPSNGAWIDGISASGLDPDFVAARVAEVYGVSAEEAERRANLELLSTEYLPAPVLGLGTGWETACFLPPMTACTWTTGVIESDEREMQRAEARITHDSSGVPWFVAIHEIADSTCVTTPACTEARCSCSSSRQVRSSKAVLVLRRLALPSTQLEFSLPSDGVPTLWVDGAVGSIIVSTSSNSTRVFTVWRFDLDAL